MTDTALDPATVPRFAPHVRFRRDTVRDRWMVMAPERMFLPDEQAAEILKLVDGSRSLADIVGDLAARYAAPAAEIAEDVAAMLQDLAARGVVRL